MERDCVGLASTTFCVRVLPMRLALYQPDIPPNAGALLRLSACLGIPVDIIEPCGFPFTEKSFRRAGLDYLKHVKIYRFHSWDSFQTKRHDTNSRMILLTTRALTAYTSFTFCNTDTLIVGRESSGVPPLVHAAVDARLVVPMAPGLRSLNVVTVAAMVLGEALRQTDGWPVRDIRS